MTVRLAGPLLGVCVGLLTLSAQSAQARQLALGMSNLYQAGELVALAWVRGTGDPCRYNEYWYLSGGYVYPGSPGPGGTIVTLVRANPNAPDFQTPAEFFDYARAFFPIGKRVVMPVLELENCGPDGFDP